MARFLVPQWEGATPWKFLTMSPITEVSDWLSSLKLLCLDMRARLEPTIQVWSTCNQVLISSLWFLVKHKYIAIVLWYGIRYSKNNFVCICFFYRLCQQQEQIQQECTKYAHRGTTSLNDCKSFNGCTIFPVSIFTGTLQGILGFTNTQFWVLVDDEYDSQESVIYWEFTDIK